jgi:uncharacterized protein YukE
MEAGQMTGQVGADLQALDTLSRTFNAQAAEIDQLIATINSQIGQTWWIGPAAENFKNQWTSQFVPNLHSLQEALRRAGAEAQSRRQRLEAAGS